MTPRQPRNPLTQDNHWWHRLKLSSQKFAVLVTISAFVTGFAYVAVTNASTVHGFAIEKLQRQLDDLKSGNEKLQIEAAELRSLSAADSAGHSLGLKPAQNFDVIPSTGGAVAVRLP